MPNTVKLVEIDHVREKLIELICSTEYGNSSLIGNNFQKGFIEKIADHLLASSFIEELQNEAYDVGAQSVLHMRYGLTWKEAREAWLAAGKWIPVSERLPEKEGNYIVHGNLGGVFGLFYDDMLSNSFKQMVTH